jgi:hypothetical protein
MPWRFSRTHSQTYKVCPKLYYTTYHKEGTGIVPKRLSLGLSRGIMAHEMLRGILSYAVEHDEFPTPDYIRVTIDKVKEEFIKEARERQFSEIPDEFSAMELDRQSTLVEGAVRAWVKTRLPFIFQHYKIVQVEEEFDVPLDEDITLMCRLDGVIQRRSDGEYSALEFKTTSVAFEDYFESWRYATQTMFHLLAIEKQFGKVGNSVMMEFLCLGTKRRDDVSGMDIYYSPLIRGFVKHGNPPLEPEMEYGFESSLARKKGWQTLNIWEEGIFGDKPQWMSNSEYWVEHVLDPEILKNQIVTREIFRNPDELKESIMNTVFQQKRIYMGIQALESASDQMKEKIMAQFFPGNMDESCFQNKYHKKCDMCQLCFKEVEGDPLESGLYQRREAHHLQEHNVE